MTAATIGRDVAHRCPYCSHPFHGSVRCGAATGLYLHDACPCPRNDDRRRAALRVAEILGRRRPQP